MNELRCPHKLHGYINGDWFEIKCNSRWCGARKGVVIIHRFSRETGELIKTLKFQDPVKRSRNGTS